MLATTCACAAAPSPKGAEVTESTKIPAAFHGEWTLDSKYCGHDGDDYDQRLWIKADAASYYEERHEVIKVKTGNQDCVSITYRERPDAYLVPPAGLCLAHGGKILRVGQGASYARCAGS